MSRYLANSWRQAYHVANGCGQLAYALWSTLWHIDVPNEWGDLMRETRAPGYDGELPQ